MKRKFITTGLVCLILLAMMSVGQAQETKKKIRVGIYDNRAIATAYFGSEYNPLQMKKTEFEQAKAIGDSAKIKELEAWGPKFQRQIQFQGFCRVPVDDLLFHVKDKLGIVASDAGVDMIGMTPDYAGANVETVDITDRLVALYNPSPKILDEIRQIRAVKPTALSDIVPIEYRQPRKKK